MIESNFYCKYISNNQEVIDGLLVDGTIRFTQPWVLNDPMELNPELVTNRLENPNTMYLLNGKTIPDYIHFLRIRLLEPIMNVTGILSITKNSFNFDMWSIYASGHKGLLLEIDIDQWLFDRADEQIELKKVEYLDAYSFNVDDYDVDGNIDNVSLNKDILFSKTKRWEKEKEYRVIAPLKKADRKIEKSEPDKYRDDTTISLFNLDHKYIKSIIFGSKTSLKLKNIVYEYIKGKSIQIGQALIYRTGDRFEEIVEHVEVTQEQIDKGFLDQLPMTFCFNRPIYEIPSKEEIDRLDQIPYYEGNQDWFDKYY